MSRSSWSSRNKARAARYSSRTGGSSSSGSSGGSSRSGSSKSSGGSGGSSTPSAAPMTAFERLAGERGVDLAAERARGESQFRGGQTIQGITSSSQEGIARANSVGGGGSTSSTNSFNPFISTAAQLPLVGTGTGSFEVTAGSSNTFTPRTAESMAAEEAGKSTAQKISEAIGIDTLGFEHYAAALGVSSIPAAASAIKMNIGTVVSNTGLTLNTATSALITSTAAKASASVIWKSLGAGVLALVVTEKILSLTLGGKNFGAFVGMEEASQTANIAARDALIAGDVDGYEIAAEARNEVLKENTFWENVKSYVPFLNLATEIEDYRGAAITAGAVYDKLAADKRAEIESGTTPEETRLKAKLEEQAMYDASVVFRLEKEKEYAEYERIAREEVRQAQRADDIRARNADARFWAEQRDNEREKAADDRAAIAAFWEEYRRQLLKLQDDARPSNLKFGLL